MTENDDYVHPGKRLTQSGYTAGYGQGLSVRDYIATHIDIFGMNITKTFVLKHGRDPTVDELASYAAGIKYIMADAMLKERVKDD